MTWRLDHAISRSDVTCVPIVEVEVTVNGNVRQIAGHGRKSPALILVFQGAAVMGIDTCGARHDADNIERRFPTAIALAREMIKAEIA